MPTVVLLISLADDVKPEELDLIKKSIQNQVEQDVSGAVRRTKWIKEIK